MRRLASAWAATLLLLAWPARAAETEEARCEARKVDEAEQRKAFAALKVVVDVYLQSMPSHARVAGLSDHRQWESGFCFLSMTLYTDETTHLSRLVTVLLDDRFKPILVQWIEPDSLPFEPWFAELKKSHAKRSP